MTKYTASLGLAWRSSDEKILFLSNSRIHAGLKCSVSIPSPISYQCSIWQPLRDGCALSTPIIEQELHGMLSLTKRECSVTIHNATTSTEEAWAKMKEAADQMTELFQSLQPKDWFNESSLKPQISSVLKSRGKVFDINRDCNFSGISGFNDEHGPYLQLWLAAYCLLLPPSSSPLSNT